MRRAIALACALGALAWAPAAFAGTPFTIGSGSKPHLLVDPTSGAAHVVWLQDQTVRYCRVPRGATACGGPLKVKLRRVDFFIGRKRVTIDRKAPYRKTLKVPIRSRAKVNVRARAFIKVKRGKSPTKPIRAKVGANVDVC